MPRPTSQLTSLEVHKRLLLIESEVNRAQFIEECACFHRETNDFLAQGRTVLSTAATAAATAAGLSALRRFTSQRKEGKTSLFRSFMRALRLGASVWAIFRTRSN